MSNRYKNRLSACLQLTRIGPKATPRARYQLPKSQYRFLAVKKRLMWVQNRRWSKFQSYMPMSTIGNPESKSQYQKATPRVIRIPDKGKV